MFRMTKQEYYSKLRKAKIDNIYKQRRQNIKEERSRLSRGKGIETNKLMAIYLFVLLNAIIVYAMIAMWTFGDLTYLGVLITDIGAQVLIYAIYCMKAYYGKKQEENMKFEREKLSGTLDELLAAGGNADKELADEEDLTDSTDEACG